MDRQDRRPVEKNDGSVPTDQILCTTYQMRNFYKQFGDGYASHLDVMNYIQHLKAARMCGEGDVVLDVCCGRSLMLPLLRYYAKDIDRYIGVEIEPDNLTPRDQRVTDGKEIEDPEEYYPFEVEYLVCDAAEMDTRLAASTVDLAIYTSSIEHMHPKHGRRSLKACWTILKPGGTLFLSCPNTPPGQDGYDVQYKAHVYEWKLAELEEELRDRGFIIRNRFGLTGTVRDLKEQFKNLGLGAERILKACRGLVPLEFLKPVLFAPFPEAASEVLLIAERSKFKTTMGR